MKPMAHIAVVAALSLLAAPALAQSSSSSSSSSSMSSSSSSSAPSTELPANVDNWGSLISALQAGVAVDLDLITASTTVNIVSIKSIKANGNSNALDNALDKNKDAVATLKTNVSENAILTAKLTAAGFTADQVVAVTAEADGSVTVFVDDRT